MCLSVKTQPAMDVLQEARSCGLLAEVISLGELRAALSAGFPMSDIVVNGPAKFVDHQTAPGEGFVRPATAGVPSIPAEEAAAWPQERVAAVFADSLSDLQVGCCARGPRLPRASCCRPPSPGSKPARFVPLYILD